MKKFENFITIFQYLNPNGFYILTDHELKKESILYHIHHSIRFDFSYSHMIDGGKTWLWDPISYMRTLYSIIFEKFKSLIIIIINSIIKLTWYVSF